MTRVKSKKSQAKTKKFLIQFTEYMISGGAWFWVGYASFGFMDLVLGISFWPAKLSSYFIGASVNFLLQRYWVFKQKKNSKKELGDAAKRYYSLMVVNFVLDQVIVGGLRALGLTPYIGQFVSSGFFTVWNWLWYSLWVFKKQPKPVYKKQHAPVLKRSKYVKVASVKR
jgi:putative flippase GtrA